MLYAIEGTHPKTGNQWRFFQAINFTYIPRTMRRHFADQWVKVFEKTNNIKFTWETVERRYPYLKHAVRRYFFKPNYYITDIKEIPFEDMEKAIVSTWGRDFSKKIKTALIDKFRRVMGRRKQMKV
jgi:hypothetical protein